MHAIDGNLHRTSPRTETMTALTQSSPTTDTRVDDELHELAREFDHVDADADVDDLERAEEDDDYEDEDDDECHAIVDPQTLCDEAVAGGDVDGLFDLLVKTPTVGFFGASQQYFEQLYRLILERCRLGDARQVVEQSLDRGVATIRYLSLRTELFLLQRIAEHDRHLDEARSHEARYVPDAVVENLIPRFMQMQRHLAEVSQLQTTTARQRALTEAKQLEIDEKKRAARDSQRLQGNPSSNGHTKNGVHKGGTPRSNPGNNGRLIPQERFAVK